MAPRHAELLDLAVKPEAAIEAMGCVAIDGMTLETPPAVQVDQGTAAMQFDKSDHGLESLAFLGDQDLDLDHSGALDFDPEDCMF